MARFSDTEGREWILTVTVGAVKAVRAALDVDLADLSGKTAERLWNDPVVLVNALWLLVRDQARDHGITAAQFGEALAGQAIEDAEAALTEAVLNFFPPRKRAWFRRMKARTTRGRGVQARIETNLLTRLDQRSRSPASSALTRIRGACASFSSWLAPASPPTGTARP